jgi:hypothetical protein
MLVFCGCHERCAATNRSFVDVCTTFFNKVAHDMLMPLLRSDVHSSGASVISWVNVGATFSEQAAHDMLMPIPSSDV